MMFCFPNSVITQLSIPAFVDVIGGSSRVKKIAGCRPAVGVGGQSQRGGVDRWNVAPADAEDVEFVRLGIQWLSVAPVAIPFAKPAALSVRE